MSLYDDIKALHFGRYRRVLEDMGDHYRLRQYPHVTFRLDPSPHILGNLSLEERVELFEGFVRDHAEWRWHSATKLLGLRWGKYCSRWPSLIVSGTTHQVMFHDLAIAPSALIWLDIP